MDLWCSFLLFSCLLQEIGTALLPVTLNKALPAPAESPSEAAKVETVPEPQPEPPVQPVAEIKAKDSISKIEAVLESQPEASTEINLTPQNEVKAASQSRPLSPYAAVIILLFLLILDELWTRSNFWFIILLQYPDFKPPTSPCPSQPWAFELFDNLFVILSY